MRCCHGRCMSPLACGSFGYCRELNMQPERIYAPNSFCRVVGYIRPEHDGWSAFTTTQVFGTFRTRDEAIERLQDEHAKALAAWPIR